MRPRPRRRGRTSSSKLGGTRLTEITRLGVQALADRMLSDGHDPSAIRNTLIPLRALYRRALGRTR